MTVAVGVVLFFIDLSKLTGGACCYIFQSSLSNLFFWDVIHSELLSCCKTQHPCKALPTVVRHEQILLSKFKFWALRINLTLGFQDDKYGCQTRSGLSSSGTAGCCLNALAVCL